MKKTCSECRQEKPLAEFHKSKSNKDGLQYKCKTCIGEYQQRYQASERGKALAKRHGQSEKGKATKRRYVAANPEKFKEASRKYHHTQKGRDARRRSLDRYPEKYKARYAINNAIASGKMPRIGMLNCVECGVPAENYHHAEGYDTEHRLSVIALCISCHRKAHGEAKAC